MYRIIVILGFLFLIPYVYTDVNALSSHALLADDETIDRIVDYCFSNTMSTNPVQDLIDRGLISPAFAGEDCQSIALVDNMNNNQGNQLRDLIQAPYNDDD